MLDPQFLERMLAVCKTPQERGLILVLYHTGMHISSALTLTRRHLVKEGDSFYLRWARPKTGMVLEAHIPPSCVDSVLAWIDAPKPSPQWVNMILRKRGKKAGYDGVSAMTFRHTRCVNLLNQGMDIFTVCQIMGCTPSTVMRAYAKLSQEQLRERMRDN